MIFPNRNGAGAGNFDARRTILTVAEHPNGTTMLPIAEEQVFRPKKVPAHGKCTTTPAVGRWSSIPGQSKSWIVGSGGVLCLGAGK